MEMKGYIKLWRKSLESVVFKNANLWQTWCYCMMRANHKETKIIFEGKGITLQPGQLITGRFRGAEGCNMSPSTFRDQIWKLKKLRKIDITSDNKKTLITIINWVSYQGNSENPTTKPDKNPPPIRHRQECKNDKNEINGQWFNTFWCEYPKKVNKKKAELQFLTVCKDEKTFQEIMTALHLQKQSEQWNKNNGQFIPHPSTWLTDERWTDQIKINKQNRIYPQNNQQNESFTGSEVINERWSEDNLAKSKYHKESAVVC